GAGEAGAPRVRARGAVAARDRLHLGRRSVLDLRRPRRRPAAVPQGRLDQPRPEPPAAVPGGAGLERVPGGADLRRDAPLSRRPGRSLRRIRADAGVAARDDREPAAAIGGGSPAREVDMRRTLGPWLAAACAALAPAAASPQGLVVQKNLSLGLAKAIAEAALAECKARGFDTAVAVVDRAGQVLVVLRDERASAQTAEMARRKAYTARMFRTTTLEFQKRTTDPKY